MLQGDGIIKNVTTEETQPSNKQDVRFFWNTVGNQNQNKLK